MFVLNTYIAPEGEGGMVSFVTSIVYSSQSSLFCPFQLTDSDAKKTNNPSNIVDVNADEYELINIT